MSKTERQDAEINKLLDRLQEAHEERDKYKKYIKETLQENWCFSDKEVEDECRRILKGKS